MKGKIESASQFIVLDFLIVIIFLNHYEYYCKYLEKWQIFRALCIILSGYDLMDRDNFYSLISK